jgi:hypothetical protein
MSNNIQASRSSAVWAALFAFMLSAMLPVLPARAADPIFPPGSRLGMVPPPGMVVSHSFEGFEDIDKNAAILLSVLPAVAYDQIDKTLVPEALQKQGILIDHREPITLDAGKGFLLIGREMHGTAPFDKLLLVVGATDITALVTAQIPDHDPVYSEKALRDAFATLAVRPSVPDAERLSLLPFTVGDLAGFKIDDVLPGRALMLNNPVTTTAGDAAKDASPAAPNAAPSAPNAPPSAPNAPPAAPNARFLIAAVPGGPNESEDHASFARVAFGQIGGIKDVQIQDAEPLRIGNVSGFQILAKAKDAQSDADVMVVQWLRFGGGGFMQMIGIARAAAWPDVFNRMRAVRDSIDPK